MKDEPKISVIIPVYNVEKYIIRCLDSLYLQDYENYEIIIVNDCSPDNSRNIISEYIKTNDLSSKTIILDHSINRGLSAARNTGIKAATGKYILFIDSDDWVSPGMFRTLSSRMESEVADFCCFRTNAVDTYGNIMPIGQDYDVSIIEGRDNIVKETLLGNNIKTSAWSKIYTTSFIKDNELLFYEGIINEDAIFTKQMATYANKVTFENTFFYNLYSNETSISRDIKDRNFTSLNIVLIEVCKAYKNRGLYDTYKHYIYASWCKLCLFTLVQAAYRVDYKRFKYLKSLLAETEFNNLSYTTISLLPKKLSFVYVLTNLSLLFYMFIRILKFGGLKMQ